MWYDKYHYEVNQIIKYSALGYEKGLVCASGGNVSMRCDRGIIITASGTCLRELEPNQMLLIALSGEELENPQKLRPSKESGFHINIYRKRHDVNCVYHVHPLFSTAFSSLGLDIPRVTSWARNKLGKIPLIPEARSGSTELATLVENAVSDNTVNALLLSSHGVITFGTNMEDSFNLAELMESAAKTAILANNIIYLNNCVFHK